MSTPVEVIKRRILEKCIRTTQGCLEWQGAKVGGGYGKIMVDGVVYRVHRWVYEASVGPIPTGMVLCHQCDNPPCCEPAHLIPGTMQQNSQEAWDRARHPRERMSYGRRLPKGTRLEDDPTLVLSRLMTRVDKKESGCIEWCGSAQPSGYGKVKVGNRYYSAHRLIYELTVGPIPEGMYLLHSCDNPKCCNVEHLRPGTQKENIQEAADKGHLMSGEEHRKRRKSHSGDLHYMRSNPEKREEATKRIKGSIRHTGKDHWANKTPEGRERARRHMDSIRDRSHAVEAYSPERVERSRKVLQMRSEGRRIKDIAKELGMSVRMVAGISCGEFWKKLQPDRQD